MTEIDEMMGKTLSSNDEMTAFVKSIAIKKANTDREDFSVDDIAAGNIDDAWSAGCSDGEIYLAREILRRFGK